MNSRIFTDWLKEFDVSMKKQKRHVLLFLDNAPVHPPDVQLDNIKMKFFPANTTAKIQPMDQGIIRTFKAYYRRHLVKHIIANASTAMTADDVTVTALDAVYWIDSAWQAVTPITIRKTFRVAGFEDPTHENFNTGRPSAANADLTTTDTQPMEELGKVLKHLAVGGRTMSAEDYAVRLR